MKTYGKLAFEGEYLDGKRQNGKGKECDEDGNVKFEGEYKDGNFVGYRRYNQKTGAGLSYKQHDNVLAARETNFAVPRDENNPAVRLLSTVHSRNTIQAIFDFMTTRKIADLLRYKKSFYTYLKSLEKMSAIQAFTIIPHKRIMPYKSEFFKKLQILKEIKNNVNITKNKPDKNVG